MKYQINIITPAGESTPLVKNIPSYKAASFRAHALFKEYVESADQAAIESGLLSLSVVPQLDPKETV